MMRPAARQKALSRQWSCLNYGQIYSTLDRLEKDDLVTYDRQIQDKRPDRKIYNHSSGKL